VHIVTTPCMSHRRAVNVSRHVYGCPGRSPCSQRGPHLCTRRRVTSRVRAGPFRAMKAPDAAARAGSPTRSATFATGARSAAFAWFRGIPRTLRHGERERAGNFAGRCRGRQGCGIPNRVIDLVDASVSARWLTATPTPRPTNATIASTSHTHLDTFRSGCRVFDGGGGSCMAEGYAVTQSLCVPVHLHSRTLAHHWVLFLDEFTEFRGDAVEACASRSRTCACSSGSPACTTPARSGSSSSADEFERGPDLQR
jgi:hypothetical protein